MKEILMLLQDNAKSEAQAVKEYSDLLTTLLASDELEEYEKEALKADISEIISDELNHTEKLLKAYTLLTGIQPNIN